MREGLVEEHNIISDNIEKESSENLLQQITDHFEPVMKEASGGALERALEHAEKLQAAFKQLLILCS